MRNEHIHDEEITFTAAISQLMSDSNCRMHFFGDE